MYTIQIEVLADETAYLSEILNQASKNDFEGCLKIKQIIHVAQKIVDPRITCSNIAPKRLKYNSV